MDDLWYEVECLECGSTPCEFIFFDEGEPLFGWCSEEHHDMNSYVTNSKCQCARRKATND